MGYSSKANILEEELSIKFEKCSLGPCYWGFLAKFFKTQWETGSELHYEITQ